MTRLLITRGLPASGRTTFPRALQPDVVRVDRDDRRRRLHGRRRSTDVVEALLLLSLPHVETHTQAETGDPDR